MPLVVDDLSFAYGREALFDRFSFRAEAGRPTVLLGPSGCGKSTLLALIAGLLLPSAGNVRLADGQEAEGGAPRRVSFVFQEPRLFPWRTALENVAIPIEAIYGKKASRDRAREFLQAVGLGGLERALPDELSGGQRQRASIARAFAYPAPLVLMDEPFQSLDLPLRIQLMDLTLDLLERERRIAVAATHDPREALYLADRAVVIAGRPVRVVLDERIDLPQADRAYSSVTAAPLEARIFAALSG